MDISDLFSDIPHQLRTDQFSDKHKSARETLSARHSSRERVHVRTDIVGRAHTRSTKSLHRAHPVSLFFYLCVQVIKSGILCVYFSIYFMLTLFALCLQ